MGGAHAKGLLLASAGICGAYAALLAVASPASRGWLGLLAVALSVAAGWLAGARAGGVLGALLGALQLAFAPASATPLVTYVTFVVAQLVLVLAAYGAGTARQRLEETLAHEQRLEARHALALAGTDDALWEWDIARGTLLRSPRFRDIAGTSATIAEPVDAPHAAVHPDDRAGAQAALEAHLAGTTDRYEHAHRIRHTDGSWRWVLERGAVERDARGTPLRMAGFLTDISAHKETEARLRHHAFHDALTGLPNRALFMDRVQHAVARARRAPTSAFAVLMIDLDRFKSVNDSLGHAVGDQLLVRVAECIAGCVREGDTVARLGGDEFSVLLESVDDAPHAERVATQIQRALGAPVPIEGQRVSTSASIGIVLARDDAFDALALLRRADQAMYGAKKQGRGRSAVFDASAYASTSMRHALEDALRVALEAGQLRVYLQPIVAVDDGVVRGFEALVRWPHPKLGLVSPAELLPVAEASDTIVALSDFVLGEACRALSRLRGSFGPSAPRVAVNLSARELGRDDLADRVGRALTAAQLPPEALVLEVKESALMDDEECGRAAFRALRARGVRIHMDDFGTGVASLGSLHRFEIDGLKIDGAFIGRLHDDPEAVEIVRTIVTIARDLRLDVVAEGVENRAQHAVLKSLGCAEAQGFLFGAALPLEAVEALLRRGTKLAG
ncbi:MAG: EAL domain-containing protein [Polyangiales bacterium]